MTTTAICYTVTVLLAKASNTYRDLGERAADNKILESHRVPNTDIYHFLTAKGRQMEVAVAQIN